MKSVLLPLLFFSSFLGTVSGVSEQVETQPLYDYLFTNYTSNLLPRCGSGKTVTMRIDIALRQIIELNEPEQILTINAWMRLNWQDCRLTWNPATFNNLTYITVLYEDVWTPDITLYDSAASEDSMFPGRENYRAYISSSGSVSYNFPTLMISICRVNVKFFPFDTQTCSLKFGSWSHHGFELDIESKNPAGDTDIFILNSEWVIKDFPAERRVAFYNCCPEPYPDVTYYVILKRRPLFYLMTMFFPCILVTFVAGLTFLLPTESGEKISLEITVLLSLSVFLLLVSEALPPSSDNFPIIGIYFGISMVLVSMSLVQTVIVVNLFHRGKSGRKVPRWVQLVFFQFLGKILCVHVHRPDKKRKSNKYEQNGDIYDVEHTTTKLPKNNTPIKDKIHTSSDSKDVIQNGGLEYTAPTTNDTKTVKMLEEHLKVLKSIESLTRDANDETSVIEWQDISNIVDRLFLILFSLVSIVTTVVFVVQMMS